MSRKQEIIFEPGAVGRGAGTVNADRGVGEAKDFSAFLDVTAETGTATLDVKFQEWDQASEKWYDITGGAFAQATGIGSERITFSVNAKRIRCNQVLAGTTPTMDYTVGAIGTP
jgi:hypothetical protein